MRIGFNGDAFSDLIETLAGLLPDEEVGLADHLGELDVLIPAKRPVRGEDLDRHRPRLVQTVGAGLDMVDLDAARERDIAVAHNPAGDTANAAGVAEIAVLHLLELCRGGAQAREAVAAGKIGRPMGYGLNGRAVTLLGVGGIGREVARRLRGFGVELIGVGRRDEPGAELSGLLDRYTTDLHDALASSDDVVAALPLADGTRGILGEREFATMRGGGFVVNVGRGPLLDYEALLAALRSGQVGGAGLDVFWSEPIDPADPILAENVSVTPHIGGLTEQAWRDAADRIAENARRLRDGKELRNRAI